MLANIARPGSEAFTSSITRDFISAVSTKLEGLNRKAATEITFGTVSGPTLDKSIVHREQSAVQDSLNELQASNPEGYKTVVRETNRLLNPTGSAALAGNMFSTDRAYQQVLKSVREELGRDIDFSNQEDREKIGNAVIDYVRSKGGCDITGSRIKAC